MFWSAELISQPQHNDAAACWRRQWLVTSTYSRLDCSCCCASSPSAVLSSTVRAAPHCARRHLMGIPIVQHLCSHTALWQCRDSSAPAAYVSCPGHQAAPHILPYYAHRSAAPATPRSPYIAIASICQRQGAGQSSCCTTKSSWLCRLDREAAARAADGHVRADGRRPRSATAATAAVLRRPSCLSRPLAGIIPHMISQAPQKNVLQPCMSAITLDVRLALASQLARAGGWSTDAACVCAPLFLFWQHWLWSSAGP